MGTAGYCHDLRFLAKVKGVHDFASIDRTRWNKVGPMITINGVTKTAAEWACESGVHADTIRKRVRYGITGEALISKNLHTRRRILECDCGQTATMRDGSGWQCERCHDLNSKVFIWHDIPMGFVDVEERQRAA